MSLFRYHYLPTLCSTIITRFFATTVDSAIHIPFAKASRFCRLYSAYYHPCRDLWTSQVSRHIFTGSLTSLTPGRECIHPDLAAECSLLLAGSLTPSALPRRPISRLITFILNGFRLASFAVYASSLSLPTVTQDSLHSGIGSPSMAGLSPARFARLTLAHQAFSL